MSGCWAADDTDRHVAYRHLLDHVPDAANCSRYQRRWGVLRLNIGKAPDCSSVWIGDDTVMQC
jgi:hypothetical protein